MKCDPFIAELTEFIKPLPEVANRVLFLARKDPVNFRELTLLIETDPTLSAMILSLANSPLYGSLRHQTDSLSKAILVLGRDQIIDSTMVYVMQSIQGATDVTWPGGDTSFWKHCIGTAIAARMLAQKMNVSYAQQSFIAGLLHDVGKLALLNHNPSRYKEVIEYAEESNRPLHYVELEEYGVTHGMISGAICRKWHLPITCTKAVLYHHDEADFITATVANTIRSANLLVKICGIGNSGNDFGISATKLLLPHPRFSEADIYEILAVLADLVDELSVSILGGQPNHAMQHTLNKAKLSSVQDITVYTKKESDRLLFKYLVYALGFNRSAIANKLDVQTHRISPVIMDHAPSHQDALKPVIDFSKWRAAQPNTPGDELNIASLRSWLFEQVETLGTCVAKAS